MKLPSESTVSRLIGKWGKRLGLLGWAITWKWADSQKIAKTAGYPAVAYADCRPTVRKAVIYLSNDVEWDGDPLDDTDLELTVIHELIHIRMWSADSRVDDVLTFLEGRLQSIDIKHVEQTLTEMRETYVESVASMIKDGFDGHNRSS